jgi:Asp-tRNA(Asn)/Glu-tRNA(Gln) amidotransferase B subunit
MLAQGKLSTSNGLAVLAEMVETGADPEHILEEKALNTVSDENELAGFIDQIIENNPTEVERYQKGEKQLFKFFLGQIMKATGGKADPNVMKAVLEERLG